jgi:acid phosphatase type 7
MRRLWLLGLLVVIATSVLVGLLVVRTPGSAPIPSRGPVATPPPVPVGAAVLVGAGDIATCEGVADDQTALLLDAIEGTVFTAGDNAYPDGATRDFASCYDPTWGRHRDRTRPAIGNHELEDDRTGAPYFAYFGERAGARGQAWYAYDLGAWRIVVLDSNCVDDGCVPDSPQADWLRDELATNPTRCRAAIWHHASFSSGDHGDDRRMAALWRILQQAATDLVIVGHDHDYERFAPLLADGTPSPDGIRSFVVGTGGAPLRPLRGIHPGSEVRQSDSHGVLRLALREDGYDWAFIPIPGATFTDSGSATCR